MNLQEVTLRFQSLCHDGYSMSELKVKSGDKELKIKDVVFLLEADFLKSPIELMLDDESERENAKLTVLGDDV